MEFAEIKKIITEKINALDGVFSGQEFNEKDLNVQISLPSHALFVPLENFDELMSEYDNYAQMTEFLGATTLQIPEKKKAYFAVYSISAPRITKEIYCIDRFFTGAKIFAVKLIRTITWNSMSGYISEQRMNNKAIPMRVNQPWNHDAGSKYTIVEPDTLREEPIISTLLDMKCYGVMDYIAELEQAIAHNQDKDMLDQLHVSLSWTELVNAKSIKEIKETKWKKIQTLTVNKGKFNVFQLNAIKNMRPYITWEQTDRFIQALRNGAPYSTDAQTCIHYLLKHLSNGDAPVYGYVIKDTCKMLKDLKKRLDMPNVTGQAINRLHNQITREHIALLNRRKYSGKANILNIHDKYTPLCNALNKDKRFTLITRASDLVKEGEEMGHCVGTYIEDVNNGHCIISKAQIGDDRVTIELCVKNKVFYPRQVQLKYNKRPSEKTHQEVYALLDTVNPEGTDYRQYGVGRYL